MTELKRTEVVKRHLVCLGDDAKSVKVEINKDAYTIGSLKGNDLVLGRARVKKRHAIVRISGQACYVTGGEKAGNIYVNGDKLIGEEKRALRNGDRVVFGDIEYRYEHGGKY